MTFKDAEMVFMNSVEEAEERTVEEMEAAAEKEAEGLVESNIVSEWKSKRKQNSMSGKWKGEQYKQ